MSLEQKKIIKDNNGRQRIKLDSFHDYTILETEDAQKEDNVKETRAKVGHEPSRNELMENYISSGRAKKFREKYSYPEDKG